jgi:serine/threonine protein kinase
MFATGVILFIMYKGVPPFLSTKDKWYNFIRNNNFSEFWAGHEKNKPPGFYPASFKNLMNSFFNVDPNKRPTFESLETSEWLNEHDISNKDLITYMKAKNNKRMEQDEKRQKIATIKKEMFLKEGTIDCI